MSDVLDQDAVREYLAELDGVLSRLPTAQGDELREQIVAHLEDAIEPGADPEEVAEVLRRLGPPSELAAEKPAPDAPPRGPAPLRRLAARVRRMRRRNLALLLAGLAIAGAAIGYAASVVVDLATVPSLETGTGPFGWWYYTDEQRSSTITAGGINQETTVMRFGHQQGFFITLYNPSDWSQTVLGPAPNQPSLGASPSYEVAVAIPQPSQLGEPYKLRYTDQATIAPGGYAFLRLLWVTQDCYSPQTSVSIDSVGLRVRVGWFTHTETVEFNGIDWGLVTPKNATEKLNCPN